MKYLDVADYCIQQYWSHTYQTKSHQSKSFQKDFGKHFGTFKMCSKMFYNSMDYLCTNNPDYQL
jgi:hypothetical protein